MAIGFGFPATVRDGDGRICRDLRANATRDATVSPLEGEPDRRTASRPHFLRGSEKRIRVELVRLWIHTGNVLEPYDPEVQL